MTSKISFVKYLKETMKFKTASILITVFAFLLEMIYFFIRLQNIINGNDISLLKADDYQYFYRNIYNLCAPNLITASLAGGIALFLLYYGFHYLHNKQETDFYESLPIRKQDRFKINFTSQFFIFGTLAVINTGLKLGLICLYKINRFELFQVLLWNLISMILVYLVIWVTAALVVVLTGNMIVAILGFGAVSAYVPLVLYELIPTFSSIYFDTYTYKSWNPKAQFYFSPFSIAYKIINDWNVTWTASEHYEFMIVAVVYAIVVGILAYMLYLKRPSEAAGRAMAFEKFNPFIRCILVIPISLYSGVLFQAVSFSQSTVWMIFGIVFGAIVLHGIMEGIFQSDIRAIFHKKLQLVGCIVVALGVLFVFKADLLGYDAYLPEEDELETIELDVLLPRNSISYWGAEPDYLNQENITLAREFIKEIYNQEYENMNSSTPCNVVYHLKNGAKKYRCYFLDTSKIPDSFNTLVATEDFKNDFYSLYTGDWDKIDKISCDNGLESIDLNLTKEQQREFLTTYLEELNAMDANQYITCDIVYNFYVHLPWKYIDENEDFIYEAQLSMDEYMVPTTFTKTIELLKSYGFLPVIENESYVPVSFNIYSDIEANYHRTTDEAILAELKPHLIMDSLLTGYAHYDDLTYCHVDFETDNGILSCDAFLPNNIIETYVK